MNKILSILTGLATAVALALGAATAAGAATAQRISVTGEIIDTWCYVTEIIHGSGTAHHQCAVWCAIGGIPVSVLGDDGKVYVVLRVEDDDTSVANPRLLTVQSHQVTVDGDLYERDGVRYLIVTQTYLCEPTSAVIRQPYKNHTFPMV